MPQVRSDVKEPLLPNHRDIDAILIGTSRAINDVRRLVLDVADTSASVLIVGETGTGKELVARCLHDYSGNRRGNFVPLNCGGLPESLFESEMFGYEPGAFTGATKRRIGRIEFAQNGTLFLDEIESMPYSLQTKLLRVIQEQRIEHLGSNSSISIDCRVVAAAKNNINELEKSGHLRADLYYRLNVIPIQLPPLRERVEDVPMLFEHFIRQAAMRYERLVPTVPSAFLSELMTHNWPGNVRELCNVANRFVLGLKCGEFARSERQSETSTSLADQVVRFERALIESELRKHGGCVNTASRTLCVPKTTLYEKIRRHQIALEDF